MPTAFLRKCNFLERRISRIEEFLRKVYIFQICAYLDKDITEKRPLYVRTLFTTFPTGREFARVLFVTSRTYPLRNFCR